MYCCKKRKAIFIHIPKTGGTALKDQLLKDFLKIKRKHGKLGVLKYPEKYKDYFIFTIVRNPYERLVSGYRFAQIRRNKRVEGLSFCDYLEKEWSSHKHNKLPHQQYLYIEHDFLKTHIYKFEDFTQVVNNISERLGYQPTEIEKTRQVCYHGEYDFRDWLGEDSINFINKICKKDFELFGYEMR